ncbi:hypothetical protein BKA70DRAFT_784397 [Coprinopsis sp. MPI-PUGE-AT-0042]|nr:hypothetical protein BKA70DRAFT_784397 [Coprinopsis sp. MPI-PUGE-AT-0042]
MRAFQTGHGQRMSARASRLHLHSSTINPKRVAECIARRPSVSKQCKRSFGGPAPFPQGIPESLFPSGETVSAILPNHSLDGITCSGSLTSPSPTPSKTTSDSRKEKAFAFATLYFMIPRLLTDTPALPKPHLHLPPGFIPNQSLFKGLNPSLSFTFVIPADPRFYKEGSGKGYESAALIRSYSPPGRGCTNAELNCRTFSPRS